MIDVEKIKAVNNTYVFVKPFLVGGICKVDIDAETLVIGDFTFDVKKIQSIDGQIIVIEE